jgi:hypothetical protein
MHVSHLSLRAAAALALAAITPACANLTKLTGGKLGAGSSSSSGSVTGDGGGDPAKIAATYAAFTYESCTGECTPVFRKQAGVVDYTDRGGYYQRYNPRVAANPDPAWIPGWDSLPTTTSANAADVVYQALVGAAAMKTWRARCDADYAKLHATLVAADEAMQQAIARATAEPNVYVRLGALLALRPNVNLERLDPVGTLTHVVGGRTALERALHDAYAAADLLAVYHALDLEPPGAVGEVGRPRDDLAAEREVYCAAALAGRIDATPAPSQWKSTYLDKGMAAVKPVIDEERVAAIRSTRAATAKALAAGFAPPKTGTLSRSASSEVGVAKDTLALIVTRGTISRTRRDGDKMIVELHLTDEGSLPFNCTDTGRWYPNGDPILRCEMQTTVSDLTAEVTFRNVPETVTLPAGAQLKFFGKVVNRSETITSRTRLRIQKRGRATLEGTYLVGAVTGS